MKSVDEIRAAQAAAAKITQDAINGTVPHTPSMFPIKPGQGTKDGPLRDLMAGETETNHCIEMLSKMFGYVREQADALESMVKLAKKNRLKLAQQEKIIGGLFLLAFIELMALVAIRMAGMGWL